MRLKNKHKPHKKKKLCMHTHTHTQRHMNCGGRKRFLFTAYIFTSIPISIYIHVHISSGWKVLLTVLFFCLLQLWLDTNFTCKSDIVHRQWKTFALNKSFPFLSVPWCVFVCVFVVIRNTQAYSPCAYHHCCHSTFFSFIHSQPNRQFESE